MQTATQPRPELIQIADMLAREKNINRNAILEAMEQGISKAGRSKFGPEYDIRTKIDRNTGAIFMARYLTVVEEVGDESTQISLSDAKKMNPEINLGEFITDPLPPMDFGRIAAQTAKQVITQKVKEAERLCQYEEMKDRKGQIISGIVKRVEQGGITIDIGGRIEAFLRKDECIPRENYRIGERLRALILDVRSEIKGPQVFLSRSHPEFLTQLFKAEVPEIYDGVIEIKAAVRDAGSRAKIAVWSKDNTLDARGACIGMKGIRVQAIVNELQGEKIDVVHWSSDPATFIANALAPNTVLKMVLDEETHNAEVVLSEEQLSLAIGRRGQNIRLVSQLTGWHIDMMTEEEESAHRKEETKECIDLFTSALDIDEMMARLLNQEGFASVEDIAFIPLNELASIEGFDDALAEELQTRAKAYLLAKTNEIEKKIQNLNIEAKLKELPGLTNEMLIKLAEKNILTLDDFADLASDELVDILGSLITTTQANQMIMKAREHWFESK